MSLYILHKLSAYSPATRQKNNSSKLSLEGSTLKDTKAFA